jgi:ribonuclease BN (tRNA processing enzyme)
MVQGLLASMAPSMAAGYGLPGQHIYTAAELVDVHEVGSGGTFRLGETRVAATRNSHFSFPPDSAEAARHLSLSYRFDTPDRSIVVTGDTGPSADVEALARGADLLVGEMIDVPLTVATIRKVDPGLTEQRLKDMTTHLSSHHLAPADLGAMAERAGVKTLVVTHLVPGEVMTIDHLNSYRTEIAARFGGTILMASDMDEF